MPYVLTRGERVDELARTMQSGGLILTLAPSETSAHNSSGVLPTVDADTLTDKRSGAPGRRLSDNDHDELIRQGEVLRNISETMQRLSLNLAEYKSELKNEIYKAAGELKTDMNQISSRVTAIENKDLRREGFESGLLQSARTAANQRATLVSVLIGAGTIITSIVVALVNHFLK